MIETNEALKEQLDIVNKDLKVIIDRLNVSVRKGFFEAVQYFYEQLLLEDLSIRDYQQWDIETPDLFSAAIYSGQLEIVKYFIDKGADPHVDKSFYLRTAVEMNDFEIVKYLVEEHQVEINNFDPNFMFNAPLRLAVDMSNLELVKYLVEHGANDKNKAAALEQAIKEKKLEIIERI